MSIRFSWAVTAVAMTAAASCSSHSTSTTTSPTPAATPSASLAGKTSTWDGVYTAAQASHGATLFASTCDKCHGSSAQGKTDDGGRLVGREFFEKFDGVTLDQLFTSINTLMPLDKPRSLATKDVADITAYLLRQNQMPAGASPLPDNADQLKGLKITASKT